MEIIYCNLNIYLKFNTIIHAKLKTFEFLIYFKDLKRINFKSILNKNKNNNLN